MRTDIAIIGVVQEKKMLEARRNQFFSPSGHYNLSPSDSVRFLGQQPREQLEAAHNLTVAPPSLNGPR